jgi:cell division protein FtsA
VGSRLIYGIGVDAGSDRTRAVVLVLEGGRARLVGCADAPSQGWLNSRVADAKAVTESIREAMREAEARAQTPLSSAVLGAGGVTVGCSTARGGYEGGYRRELDQSDVNLVIERASHVQFGDDQMLLHLCLRDFSVDGRYGVRDPRGQSGGRLEAFVSLITFSTQEHDALVGAANRAGLLVEETVFEPVAAAYACLRPEQRRGGVAVLDIGAESTELALYRGDALALASCLPLGGVRFTKDVVHGLGITLEDAEAVKLQYGCALRHPGGDNSVIEVPSPPGRQPREMPRNELSYILEARAAQLFRWVRRELERVGLYGELLGGVVLCGGAARLNGLCDVAEAVLNCQASWGVPAGIRDWPPALVDPAWATAAGLALYSARLKQRELERPRRGLLSKIFG